LQRERLEDQKVERTAKDVVGRCRHRSNLVLSISDRTSVPFCRKSREA
jgi:hypothetical protein